MEATADPLEDGEVVEATDTAVEMPVSAEVVAEAVEAVVVSVAETEEVAASATEEDMAVATEEVEWADSRLPPLLAPAGGKPPDPHRHLSRCLHIPFPACVSTQTPSFLASSVLSASPNTLIHTTRWTPFPDPVFQTLKILSHSTIASALALVSTSTNTSRI